MLRNFTALSLLLLSLQSEACPPCPSGSATTGTGNATNLAGCKCTDPSHTFNGTACVGTPACTSSGNTAPASPTPTSTGNTDQSHPDCIAPDGMCHQAWCQADYVCFQNYCATTCWDTPYLANYSTSGCCSGSASAQCYTQSGCGPITCN